jgi:hypothetical protein
MMHEGIAKIKKQAEQEIKEEEFRTAVEKEKERIRNSRKFWCRLFPWKLIIIRRGDV